MNTLYFECSMGAAGDMMAAALLELHPHPDSIIEQLNSAGIPEVAISIAPSVKCGITGQCFDVTINGQREESLDVASGQGLSSQAHERHNSCCESEHREHGHGDQCCEHEHKHQDYSHRHEHHHQGHSHHHEGHEHHSLSDIAAIISGLSLPSPVRDNMLAVYTLIAEAEGHVHGSVASQIHFHEVGTMDAVADIAAVCLLIHELAPDRITASPVHVGSGQVRCAHGILPVPAPATAYLLRDIPSYGGRIDGELCTPTGAALLRHFVQSFGPQPLMRVKGIGYGMGHKDFPQANCLRAMLGEDNANTDCRGSALTDSGVYRDLVVELSCNLDDMTPEEIGFAIDRLWEAGALDVFTINIGMKKNRPGVMLSCLCREEQREKMFHLFFLHTSTLGVRETLHRRSVLQRTTESLEKSCGTVRVKKSKGWNVYREKWEYDDLEEIALKHQIPLRQVQKLLKDDGE